MSAWSTVLRDSEALLQLQGRSTDGLISGWSRVQYRMIGVSQLSFLLQAVHCGEEWQKLSASLGPSEPDQMFITMEILLVTIETFFEVGKSNIFHLNQK